MGAVLDLLLIFLKGSRSEPFKKINNRFETLPLCVRGRRIPLSRFFGIYCCALEVKLDQIEILGVNSTIAMLDYLYQIRSAISGSYSGWILWNLFLAFIPLVLSFLLFRRRMISRSWLGWFSGLVVLIGVAGLLPRLPGLMGSTLELLRSAATGVFSAQVTLLWFVVLGVISLALCLLLFKRKVGPRSGLWWIGLVIFIAFLPNAPYVLTDIIHLIRAANSGRISPVMIALVVIPLHSVAIIAGFEAYVISLLNQGYYLKYHGARRFIGLGEIIVHALCAVGVYLGRFIRFNSWDLVTDPGNVLTTTLDTLTARRPMLVIFITFVVLTVLYWILKQITIGLKLRIRTLQMGDDGLD